MLELCCCHCCGYISIRYAACVQSIRVTLEWRDLRYTVPVGRRRQRSSKTILEGLSAVLLPGRLLAVMGAPAVPPCRHPACTRAPRCMPRKALAHQLGHTCCGMQGPLAAGRVASSTRWLGACRRAAAWRARSWSTASRAAAASEASLPTSCRHGWKAACAGMQQGGWVPACLPGPARPLPTPRPAPPRPAQDDILFANLTVFETLGERAKAAAIALASFPESQERLGGACCPCSAYSSPSRPSPSHLLNLLPPLPVPPLPPPDFAARMRLPHSVSAVDKAARVEAVISELGLAKCRDTYIGVRHWGSEL